MEMRVHHSHTYTYMSNTNYNWCRPLLYCNISDTLTAGHRRWPREVPWRLVPSLLISGIATYMRRRYRYCIILHTHNAKCQYATVIPRIYYTRKMLQYCKGKPDWELLWLHGHQACNQRLKLYALMSLSPVDTTWLGCWSMSFPSYQSAQVRPNYQHYYTYLMSLFNRSGMEHFRRAVIEDNGTV